MEHGVPNGVLLDNAMNPVYDAIPSPTRDDLKEMIRLACQKLNSYGITSSQSDDYCVFPICPGGKSTPRFRNWKNQRHLLSV